MKTQLRGRVRRARILEALQQDPSTSLARLARTVGLATNSRGDCWVLRHHLDVLEREGRLPCGFRQ